MDPEPAVSLDPVALRGHEMVYAPELLCLPSVNDI